MHAGVRTQHTHTHKIWYRAAKRFSLFPANFAETHRRGSSSCSIQLPYVAYHLCISVVVFLTALVNEFKHVTMACAAIFVRCTSGRKRMSRKQTVYLLSSAECQNGLWINYTGKELLIIILCFFPPGEPSRGSFLCLFPQTLDKGQWCSSAKLMTFRIGVASASLLLFAIAIAILDVLIMISAYKYNLLNYCTVRKVTFM